MDIKSIGKSDNFCGTSSGKPSRKNIFSFKKIKNATLKFLFSPILARSHKITHVAQSGDLQQSDPNMNAYSVSRNLPHYNSEQIKDKLWRFRSYLMKHWQYLNVELVRDLNFSFEKVCTSAKITPYDNREYFMSHYALPDLKKLRDMIRQNNYEIAESVKASFQPHDLKQTIKDIENKITYLREDIERYFECLNCIEDDVSRCHEYLGYIIQRMHVYEAAEELYKKHDKYNAN
jgi:hypothetical protein